MSRVTLLVGKLPGWILVVNNGRSAQNGMDSKNRKMTFDSKLNPLFS